MTTPYNFSFKWKSPFLWTFPFKWNFINASKHILISKVFQQKMHFKYIFLISASINAVKLL